MLLTGSKIECFVALFCRMIVNDFISNVDQPCFTLFFQRLLKILVRQVLVDNIL